MFENVREKLAAAMNELVEAQRSLLEIALQQQPGLGRSETLKLIPMIECMTHSSTGLLPILDRMLEKRDGAPASAYSGTHQALGLTKTPKTAFTTVEEQVISALVNLQVRRSAAEAAVVAAGVAGTPFEFEPLFRKAVELARQ